MNHYGYCPICGIDVRLKVDEGYICADGHRFYEVMTPAQREEWLRKREEGG